jgi:hypothetical protein
MAIGFAIWKPQRQRAQRHLLARQYSANGSAGASPSAHLPASFLIGALLENPKVATQLADGVPPITVFQQLASQYPALARVDARAIDAAARQVSVAKTGVLISSGAVDVVSAAPKSAGSAVGALKTGVDAGTAGIPLSIEPRVTVGLDAATRRRAIELETRLFEAAATLERSSSLDAIFSSILGADLSLLGAGVEAWLSPIGLVRFYRQLFFNQDEGVGPIEQAFAVAPAETLEVNGRPENTSGDNITPKTSMNTPR